MDEQCKPNITEEELDSQITTSYVLKEPPVEYGISNPVRYTYADYISWMDDKRREIINSQVPVSIFEGLKIDLKELFGD